MPQPDEHYCGECEYFHEGECHRYPPVPVGAKDSRYLVVDPDTTPICAEFKKAHP